MLINRCNHSCGAKSQEIACGDMEEFWANHSKVKFNLWFKFPKENWKKGPDLETGDWSWYIYGSLEETKRLKYEVHLTRNTAKVKEKRLATWGDTFSSWVLRQDPEVEKVWLSYDFHEYSIHTLRKEEEDAYLDIDPTVFICS